MQRASTQRKFVIALLAGAALCIADAAYADVTISSDATQNMSCTNGVCSPTASNAVLNVSDLESLLSSGNVTVTTTGSGGVQATNIVVAAALSWSNQSALGLDANESVVVQKKVSVPTGAGLSLRTNDGGSGGELWIVKGGRVVFRSLSSPLSINGTSYTLVKTIAALARLIAKNPSGAYALANDYDASVDGTYTKSPITTVLTGTFEGLGNSILNLSIASGARHGGAVGLFAGTGKTGAGGTIENLGLAKLTIKTSTKKYSDGGLVGIAFLTLLFNDHVTGRISAEVDSAVGGLVGVEGDAEILGSYSNVRVTGGKNSYAGGLLGYMNGGNLTNSYATGAVSSKYVAGGLVGWGEGIVDESFATGNVSAGATGGGLAGAFVGLLENSYATGAVSGTGNSSQIGGLVGQNGQVIESSYSTGAVSEIGGLLGGLVGEDESGGGISDSYWDLDTSGVSDPSQGAGNIANDPGITGLTTQQFQSGLPTGFDPSIWAEDSNINNGFPYLIANPPPK